MNITNQRGAKPVIRIDLPWVLDVAAALDDLDRVEPESTLEVAFVRLYGAQRQLAALFNASVYSHYLRASRQKGNELHDYIEKIVAPMDYSRTIGQFELAEIIRLRDHFSLVFRSEISTLPVFLVSRKDNYDVSLLITDGRGLFPQALVLKAPEAESDALEVGKCLAFELHTASGFHTFRVVEAVARRYWDTATSKPRPSPETIGMIAGQLELQRLGDIRVVESLKQMTKLHRNPLAHADVILTGDEAIAIVGMSRSVLTAMLGVLPDVPPTTGAPLPLSSP